MPKWEADVAAAVGAAYAQRRGLPPPAKRRRGGWTRRLAVLTAMCIVMIVGYIVVERGAFSTGLSSGPGDIVRVSGSAVQVGVWRVRLLEDGIVHDVTGPAGGQSGPWYVTRWVIRNISRGSVRLRSVDFLGGAPGHLVEPVAASPSDSGKGAPLRLSLVGPGGTVQGYVAFPLLRDTNVAKVRFGPVEGDPLSQSVTWTMTESMRQVVWIAP